MKLEAKLKKAIKETKDFASGKTPFEIFSRDYRCRNMCVFCGKGSRYNRPHKECLEKAIKLSTVD